MNLPNNFYNLVYSQLPNETRLAYRIESPIHPQATIMIIGWFSSRTVLLNNFLDELKKIFPNHQFISPDFRGFGYSSNDRPDTFNDFAEDFIGLLELHNINNVILLGIGLGGIVATKMATRIPSKVKYIINIGGGDINGFPEKFKYDGNQYPMTIDNIDKSPKYKVLSEVLKNTDREAYKVVLEDMQMGLCKALNVECIIDEFMMIKHLKELVFALSEININNKNNGFVDGTGEAYHVNSRMLLLQGTKQSDISKENALEFKKILGPKCDYIIIDGGAFCFIENMKGTIKAIEEFVKSFN
jgi:pimeloyl-ACP methyl ester carboxylesterase